MRKSSGLALGLAALALAAAPLPAAAAPVITFANLGIVSGNVTYGGAGGAAAGHQIAINTIAGAGTPTNAGVALRCNNCTINFTTGNNLTEGPGAAWTFAGGGSFTITGRAVQGGQVIATGTLLTGSFTGTPTFLSGGGPSVFTGIGFDTKNPALLAFYGLASTTRFRFADSNSFLTSQVGRNGSFRGSLSNSSSVVNAVPEPATLALLGGGLVGLGLVLRRRRRGEETAPAA